MCTCVYMYVDMQCGVGKCVFMVSVVYGCPVANHTENMCLVIWLLVEEREVGVRAEVGEERGEGGRERERERENVTIQVYRELIAM